MKKTVLSAMAIAALGLTACQGGTGGGIGGMGTKQTIGAGGGAVLGGLAGSQIGGGSGRLVATGAGTLIGLMLGSEIGKSLDRADVAYANQATQRAYTAPVGETIRWSNPESGNYGTVTPLRSGTTSSGYTCREYQQTIYVGGRQETAVGQACQQPDGSWRVVS